MECIQSIMELCPMDIFFMILTGVGLVFLGWIIRKDNSQNSIPQSSAQEILDDVTKELNKKFQKEDWKEIKEHIERRENGKS